MDRASICKLVARERLGRILGSRLLFSGLREFSEGITLHASILCIEKIFCIMFGEEKHSW